jgi:hypothetical protein
MNWNFQNFCHWFRSSGFFSGNFLDALLFYNCENPHLHVKKILEAVACPNWDNTRLIMLLGEPFAQ